MSESTDSAEKTQFFLYLVTLAYGEKDTPTLAQVVFLSDKEEEDTRTVAKALIENAKNTAPKTPRFDWSTLKVQGSQTLNDKELTKLVDAASQGQVGIGRVSGLKISPDWRLKVYRKDQSHKQQGLFRAPTSIDVLDIVLISTAIKTSHFLSQKQVISSGLPERAWCCFFNA